MVYIRKSIDIVSPSDGKRYDSIVKYEKSLDQKGQYIMSDREFKNMREKLLDTSKPQQKKQTHNHVHIDLLNDKVTTSHNKDI